MTAMPEPPPVDCLTRKQYDGWACCFCGHDFLFVVGAISAGVSKGRLGAHKLDVEVYRCPPGVGCGVPSEPTLPGP